MTAEQISEYFETKNSTVSNKARQIKDMFDMWYFNLEFSTQHMTEGNPFNDMVMVDGFIIPFLNINIEEYKSYLNLFKDIDNKIMIGVAIFS